MSKAVRPAAFLALISSGGEKKSPPLITGETKYGKIFTINMEKIKRI